MNDIELIVLWLCFRINIIVLITMLLVKFKYQVIKIIRVKLWYLLLYCSMIIYFAYSSEYMIFMKN